MDEVEVRKFALQMAMAPVLCEEMPMDIYPGCIVKIAQAYAHFILTGNNTYPDEQEITTEDILNTLN